MEKGYYCCENRCLFDEFIYSSTIYNPQSLNIKNTFDIIEKLKPLVNYISSNIESEEESEEEEPKINTEQTFKENECVICLTNPPNVLFCNCRLLYP